MRKLLAALAAVAIALSAGGPALAQRRPATKVDPKLVEAKKLFDEGAEAYTQGNYEAAIRAWEKSYEISRKPLIFESIANAYERVGDPRKAREYLGKWREVAPKEEQDRLDSRLKNLDARVARDDEAEAARKAEEEKRKRAQEAKDRKPVEKPSSTSLPGVILMGTGGAAVIVGVTLDLIAAGRRPDPASACAPSKGGQVCLASARDAISGSNTLATVGDIMWIAGAAVATGGLVLFIVQKSSAPKDAAPLTAFTPVVTPKGAGLWLQRRF